MTAVGTVALVDFGDTLADQTFMLVDCPRFPSWTVHYGAAVAALQRAWETGELSSRELAAAVASRLGAGNRPEDVSAYMGELCRSVRFFPVVNAALRRRRDRGDRQALVTVNPDLFADIAAHYRLDEYFDVVVGSWQHGTVDKAELCAVALDLLGRPHGVLRPEHTVLVDNIASNVTAWVERGGDGYVFVDDATFAADVGAGRVPGFLATDVDVSRSP